MSNFDDVVHLNIHFGMIEPAKRADFADKKLTKGKLLHIEEELEEFRKACRKQNIEQAADSLVDMVYVAMGLAAAMNIPWQRCWDEVHAANMRKERVTTVSQSKRGMMVDLFKPVGWVGPDLSFLHDEQEQAVELVAPNEPSEHTLTQFAIAVDNFAQERAEFEAQKQEFAFAVAKFQEERQDFEARVAQSRAQQVTFSVTSAPIEALPEDKELEKADIVDGETDTPIVMPASVAKALGPKKPSKK